MFLYIETIVAMLYGYAFWYLLSKTTSTEIIGISSALVSLATIFVTLASVGIPLGSQRFLGKLFLEKKFGDARTYLASSIIIVTLGVVICSAVILITRGLIFVEYDFSLIVITVLLMASSTISVLFRYVIIATLETKKILGISIISSGFKLGLTIFLLFAGISELGVMIAYTSAPLLATLIYIPSIVSLLRKSKEGATSRLIQSFKPIFSASIVSWIPTIIDVGGAQMGTIIVLGFQGSSEAGFYFIAFQITIGISAVIWALESVTYPALGIMKEKRKLFLWRVIKISLIIVLPLSASLMFFSNEIMEIFGNDYGQGSNALQVLLLSILPTAVTAGLSILEYSYGNYKQVLLIGLATSLPRMVLYFILIPWYGDIGAAMSYTIGAIIGFVVAIYLSRRTEMTIVWRDLGLIFLIPTVLAFLLSTTEIHYILAVAVSVILSYLLLLKIGTIKRDDVQDSLTIFPENISNPLISTINGIACKLNKNY